MPARMVREGILTSEPVNSLSWQSEVFYRRLMSVVDDFGRYYAKPTLLRAACYPLKLDSVSDSDIGKWLTDCVNAALVRVYPAADGKRYLEILKFDQRVRASVSRFPAFDGQMAVKCQADDGLDVDVDVDVDVGERTARTRASLPGTPPPGVDAETWRAWVRHKGRKQTVDADRLQRKRLAEWRAAGHDVNAIVETATMNGWAGLREPDRPRGSARERGLSVMDEITGASGGRDIFGHVERAGERSIPLPPPDLRQQAGFDVGGDEGE